MGKTEKPKCVVPGFLILIYDCLSQDRDGGPDSIFRQWGDLKDLRGSVAGSASPEIRGLRQKIRGLMGGKASGSRISHEYSGSQARRLIPTQISRWNRRRLLWCDPERGELQRGQSGKTA